MTIAVAVNKGGRTVVAADTLVHFGGKRIPGENYRAQKVRRVGHSVLAWSGWALYADILDDFLDSGEAPDLSNERSVFRFFVRFWSAIRENYTFVTGRTDTSSMPFTDLDSTFLITNASGIFRISGELSVARFSQYFAVGSGANYALGALRILYDQSNDPAAIAHRAAQVAIDFDVYCGGKIDVMELE